MNGTRASHTLVSHLMPPKMTSDTSTTSTRPTTHWGTPGRFSTMTSLTALACTAEPMPNDASAARAAKAMAPTLAHQGVVPFFLKARSQAYMAPPSISPLWSLTRYFTLTKVSAYLVAMPKTPVSHIHSTAPGPPDTMAVPTPTMLPVPIVGARAAHSAPKGDTSPGALGSFWNVILIAAGILRWMNPVRMVRNR